MPGRDLRYAARGLRSHPGFTAVAVISLALGIGVNTAIFSLVDQLLLWRVPAREPERIMRLSGGYSDTYPFFREYRERQQVFTALFAGSRAVPVGLRPDGAAAVETGDAGFVSGEYFETLGIGAAAGRILTKTDDAGPGSGPVAVLSYRYWQKRFAGDLGAIGKNLAVNGFPLTIVGIAEAGFHGVEQGSEPDVFVPLTMYPTVAQAMARAWNTPSMFWLTTYGRLKPGVSASTAQAAMQVLWPQAAEAVNASIVQGGGRKRRFREGQITLAPGSRPSDSWQKEMADPLRILAFATGLVLLIACANVANLLLARAAGRRREIAVRLAMGASRGRLVKQLLSESLLLAAIGGTLGLAVAWGGVTTLSRARILGPELEFAPSLRLLGFSALVTILTGVVFGLAPAFHATRLTLSECLKDGGGSGAHGGRVRLGKALVAVQVALSITLLVGAGPFLRTLRNLKNVDLGYRPENVLTVDIDPSNLGYNGHRLRTFYDQLLERTRAIPGVRAAGLTSMTPFGNWALSYSLSVEGYQPKAGERMVALANPVSDGLLTTLGVPLLLGRDFRPSDEPAFTPGGTLLSSMGRNSGSSSEPEPNASPVCIIDEVMARKYFGGANPVGKHISYKDRYDPKDAIEIVGVAKSAHYSRVKQEDDGLFYIPSWSNGAGSRIVAVRMAGDVAQVTAAIRREARALDSNVPVLTTRTIEQGINAALSRQRLVAYLAGFFAVLALGLASVGLYGVMAYAVAGRTREVGIRMALGAQRTAVIAMIVRESLVPVAIGIGAGLAAALGLSKLVAGMLFGVAPRDPLSLAAASAAMVVVALAAAALPAQRASRIEPMDSLRHE